MGAQEQRALYVISVAAELAGVHPQTLRFYERKGLIAPARTPGRSRRYSEADIKLLRRIQALTAEGVGLAGVRRILDLERRLAEVTTELETLRVRMEAELAEVRRRTRRDLVPRVPAGLPVRVHHPGREHRT